jgi:hypothetical protein
MAALFGGKSEAGVGSTSASPPHKESLQRFQLILQPISTRMLSKRYKYKPVWLKSPQQRNIHPVEWHILVATISCRLCGVQPIAMAVESNLNPLTGVSKSLFLAMPTDIVRYILAFLLIRHAQPSPPGARLPSQVWHLGLCVCRPALVRSRVDTIPYLIYRDF